MKKARMNISHSRFILFKLKIFGEIVTTNILNASLAAHRQSSKEKKQWNKIWVCAWSRIYAYLQQYNNLGLLLRIKTDETILLRHLKNT